MAYFSPGLLRGLLGPGEVLILGPWRTCHCTYYVMLCCMKALVYDKRGFGGFPPEKILENAAILCILVAQNGL